MKLKSSGYPWSSSTAVWLPRQKDSCNQSPNLSGCDGLDAEQIQDTWPHRHWQSLVHDITLLMACLDVLNEDILGWKGFAYAHDVNAMKFCQMLKFRAIALGNYCHHRLVVFKALKNEAGVNHTLTNCQKWDGLSKQCGAQGNKLCLCRWSWDSPLGFWSP